MSTPDLSLAEKDPEVTALIAEELQREQVSLDITANTTYTSERVRTCIGSCLTNKYSEGLPGKRYYAGNEYID